MYREIYIDVVFVTNFLMDFVLLRLTGMFLGIHAAWCRCFCGAVLGAVSSCFILFIPTDYVYPAAFVLHVITAAAMARIGYKIDSKRMLARITLTLYVLAFLCGGFWDILTREREMALWMFLCFTGLSYCFLAICVRGYQNWLRKRETYCRVKLKAQGKTVDLTGLYDTGNLLPTVNTHIFQCNHRKCSIIPHTAIDNKMGMQTFPHRVIILPHSFFHIF